MITPEPGDFAVVAVGGAGGVLIGLGERLNGDAFSAYQHAFVYVGDGYVIEAESGGARRRQVNGWPDRPEFVTPGQLTAWSTGQLGPLTPSADQRTRICAAAEGYVGTPYSWLDYFAIAAHRLHLPVPGLKGYIASTGHMICSQLVDQCYADAGVHLFADGRWPGYVTPADLAALIEGA